MKHRLAPSPARWHAFAISSVSALAGATIASGFFLLFTPYGAAPHAMALRESDLSLGKSPYTFIDPLVGIRGVNDSSRYAAMKRDLQASIASAKKGGLVSASVDFRDINEPGGFVLGAGEQYTPASLNKVPVMMAYLKIAESDSALLSATLTYTGQANSDRIEEIRSAVQLAPGRSYTVRELIVHMIRYSDNNAADLLTKHLADIGHLNDYAAVFSDLGIDLTVLTAYTDNMTVRDYSIFLRALYNATYLSRDDSEYALQLLSETDFTSGIEAGVPNGVLIAQKFDEVRMTDAAGALVGKELNDCGIVYYPGHPYLLCVMTKGTGDDVAGLESAIAAISRAAYEGMQRFYPQN